MTRSLSAERHSAYFAARHLQDGHLVLYDITSSYFEGAYTQSDLVTFAAITTPKRGPLRLCSLYFCARNRSRRSPSGKLNASCKS